MIDHGDCRRRAPVAFSVIGPDDVQAERPVLSLGWAAQDEQPTIGYRRHVPDAHPVSKCNPMGQ
jgi:hypothetical protein